MRDGAGVHTCTGIHAHTYGHLHKIKFFARFFGIFTKKCSGFMDKIDIAPVEAALKTAFTGLPAHSIDLVVNMPSELGGFSWPFRYKWKDGKLFRQTVVSIAPQEILLTEV